MKCAQVEEQMAAYVVHELQDVVFHEIQCHIQTCGSCQRWYREVQEMAQIWAGEDTTFPVDTLITKDSPLSELNLVEPVLQKIQSRHRRSDTNDVNDVNGKSGIADTSSANLPQKWRQRRGLPGLPSRMVYVHYGLAASFTIALFQFGVFQHLGLGIVNNGILLSHQVQSFLQILSTL
jgi:hypothetical protein